MRIRQETSEPGVVANTVKIFVDGVIEAATAALLEPYLPLAGEQAPVAESTRGLPNFTDERLKALVARLDREGFQTHMHAIGDGAIRQGLDAIEAAERANGPRDRRPHIAHIQLFHPDDVAAVRGRSAWWPTCSRSGRTPTAYITRRSPSRGWGPSDRSGSIPSARSTRRAQRLAGGSDWSVTSVNPLHAIQVAVTRKALDAPADGPRGCPSSGSTSPRRWRPTPTVGRSDVRGEGQRTRSRPASLPISSCWIAIRTPSAPHDLHRLQVQWTLKEGKEVFRAPTFTPAPGPRPSAP